MKKTIETRVVARSHRADFPAVTFKVVSFPFCGQFRMDTFSQVVAMQNNNAVMQLANYTLTRKWDSLRWRIEKDKSLLHDVLCHPEIEEIICRMTYSGIFMRNNAPIPNGVYVTSPAAFGTDEPRRMHLRDEPVTPYDLVYHIRDIFYSLPVDLFAEPGFAEYPISEDVQAHNVLAYGRGVENAFAPNICFDIKDAEEFLEFMSERRGPSRLKGTISLNAEGYASPYQYFDMETYVNAIERYNEVVQVEQELLRDEDEELIDPIRRSYLIFTMQMNGVDLERIWEMGILHDRESAVPDIPNDTLVDDSDVLCE